MYMWLATERFSIDLRATFCMWNATDINIDISAMRYTPIPLRPPIARIATNWFFFLFREIREVSLFFFSHPDALRVSPDSDTMSLRIFGGIGSIRLESRKNSLRLAK